MSGSKDLLTVKEAAAYLGVSQPAVWVAIAEERIPSIVKYSKRLIERAELEAYKSRTQPDGAPKPGRPKKQVK